MKTMYRILGVSIGLVVALCGCDYPPKVVGDGCLEWKDGDWVKVAGCITSETQVCPDCGGVMKLSYPAGVEYQGFYDCESCGSGVSENLFHLHPDGDFPSIDSSDLSGTTISAAALDGDISLIGSAIGNYTTIADEFCGITMEGATADTPETTFIVGPDVTQDETWTINTDADSRSAMSLKGPTTLTFYFGNEQCGQLKCDGQTMSFTGDMDKSAQEFVDMVNKIFEWQRTGGK